MVSSVVSYTVNACNIPLEIFQNIVEYCSIKEQFKFFSLNVYLHRTLKIKSLKDADHYLIGKIGNNILQPRYSKLKELKMNYSHKNMPLNHLLHLQYLTGYFDNNVTHQQISNLTKLEELFVGFARNINFNHLINLKKLKLLSCSIKTENISELTQLEYMDILNYDKIDFSTFTNLKTFKISGHNNNKLNDDMIIPLTTLTHVDINYCYDIADINCLTNLEYLSVNRCDNIKYINNLCSLTELHIRLNNNIDQNGLNRLTQLKILNLDDIKNPINIYMLTNLTTLDLYKIETIQNTQLCYLTNLINLQVIACPNITDVGHLTKITKLTIGENDLNIDEINKLVNITQIYMFGFVSDDVGGMTTWKCPFGDNITDIIRELKEQGMLACSKYQYIIDQLNLPKLVYLEYGYTDE